MKKLCLNLVAFLCCSFVATGAFAQLRTPAPSPGAKVMQTVGLTEVTVEYSRPGVKDRTVFGGAEALEQYGEPWRTGANAATKISFNKDVQVGGKDLEAGSYALFTIPDPKEWTVMFFNYDTPSAGGYGDKEPVVEIKVPSADAGRKIESFTIDINNLRNNSATIDLMWDKVLVSIPLAVHTDKEVMAAFEKMKEGPSAGEYYNMGMYMASADKDLDKALEYVQKVTKGDNAQFWQVHQEALLLGKLKKYDEAMKAAQKSMELAKKAGNDDYVKLNEKAMAMWKGKM